MNTPVQSAARQYLRLRDEFRESFPWGDRRLSRDDFRDWARTIRNPPIHIGRHKWRPMRDGKPVPMEMVEAFAEYVGDATGILARGECRLSRIAAPCEPPVAAAEKPPARLRPAWEIGWQLLFGFLFDRARIDDEAFCADEADLEYAARMNFEYVGWQDRRLTGDRAVAYSRDEVLIRTVEEYARQLMMFWKANEYSVLFATMRQGGAVRRIGVSVAVPVTADFRSRFRVGEAEEIDMRPDDCLPRSTSVLVHALSENLEVDMKRNKAARSLAQYQSIVYQLAALLHPVHREGHAPHLISLAGNAENGRRLSSYGWKPTGAKLKLNGRDVYELAPPEREKLGADYIKSLADYLTMKTMIQIFQASIEAQQFSRE